MSESCIFPSCPSGEWTKEIKDDLKIIQEKQDKHYDVLTKFGSIIAQIESLQRDISRHEVEHNEIYNRIRSVENDKVGKQELVWGVATLAGLLGMMQIVFHIAWG